MPRILHCSDVHLERRFAGAAMTLAEAERRRAELRAAFERIVDLALGLQADALTIAGDLYEHEYATDATGAFLAAQFRRLERTPVLIAPGNHDPHVPGSLYERVRWPDNVTVFGSDGWRSVRAADGTEVWGIGHDGPDMRRRVLAELAPGAAEGALLLFHGADMSEPVREEAAHCPFRPDDIERTGAAFALVGHEHTWRAARRFAYPGSPEPLGFFTEGPHFAMLTTVDGGSARAEPLQVSRVIYQTVYVETGGLVSEAQVLRAIEQGCAAIEQDAVVRVVLTGYRAPELRLGRGAMERALRERLRYVELADATEPAPSSRSFSLAAAPAVPLP